MIIAEWSGRKVTLYTDTKIQFRQINVPHNVVGVQVSGDSRTDAMVSIAMDNGRTWLYKRRPSGFRGSAPGSGETASGCGIQEGPSRRKERNED